MQKIKQNTYKKFQNIFKRDRTAIFLYYTT